MLHLACVLSVLSAGSTGSFLKKWRYFLLQLTPIILLRVVYSGSNATVASHNKSCREVPIDIGYCGALHKILVQRMSLITIYFDWAENIKLNSHFIHKGFDFLWILELLSHKLMWWESQNPQPLARVHWVQLTQRLIRGGCFSSFRGDVDNNSHTAVILLKVYNLSCKVCRLKFVKPTNIQSCGSRHWYSREKILSQVENRRKHGL